MNAVLEANTQYTLVNFNICPYGQRVLLGLALSGVSYKHISLHIYEEKPDWFIDKVKCGKVPALFVESQNGKDTDKSAFTISESLAILYYLMELTQCTWFPGRLEQDCKHRELIFFADDIHSSLKSFFTAEESQRKSQLDKVHRQLSTLENVFTDLSNYEPWMMIDIVYAPLFNLIKELEEIFNVEMLAQYPELEHWSNNLLMSEVFNSISDVSFSQNLRGFISNCRA
ncbi:glutathione S-transferase family protein [Pseudoalteromonas sp. OOF1S-7]|uniref:glutathione S-transferase family protein n=1 Tax=Pseudoalteromonas sp. OOF1S-7 TaxID=2917757 RepID=UPI001EF6EC1A|nr:glutathione S-transferase family protein [Pseudoalteromonas sp. OOF1S-7]MCG7534597.1 glutathione S-transferase family protein [Pseudoalteromonas sp. OOF1S-7]